MGFRGVRVGSVAVLVDIDDAVSGRLQKGLQWRRPPQQAAPAHVTSAAVTLPPAANNQPLAQQLAGIDWYHTIDLGDSVVTPGSFDHRPYLDDFRLPERLDGLRVLDVATFDGFWAFELERRGAAEVVAIDLDRYGEVDIPSRVRARLTAAELNRPLGRGFALAHRALRSRVERRALSVYDLSPERAGTFDFVFCSDLLLHLKSPIEALENIRRVTRGRAVIVDTFNPVLPQKTVTYLGGAETCVWWFFSLGALEQMIRDAGFGRVTLEHRFRMKYGNGRTVWQAVFSAQP